LAKMQPVKQGSASASNDRRSVDNMGIFPFLFEKSSFGRSLVVRINEHKLRRQIKRYLSEDFESLVLENGSGENWVLTLDRHPETSTKVILAQHGERTVIHPKDHLEELLVSLSRQDGFIKHSYLIGQGKRIRLDARYGKVKEQELEEKAWKKVSGGRHDIIRPDNAAPLLTAIGIMKANGSISAREHKKYKQINDFLRVCKPIVEKLRNRPRKDGSSACLKVTDFACGNSYLSFALAWYLKVEGVDHKVHGIDVRGDVIERSRKRAKELCFETMSFECQPVASSEPRCSQLGISLHGCDTATDEAIMKGVSDGAEALMVVPCCQNEVFKQLEASSAFPELCKQSLYRRAYATVLTDSLRAMALEALGYKVKILEFTAALHTTKSLMIRAEIARKPQEKLRREYFEACQKHGVKPAISGIFERYDAL
jgi:hypothetical protein